MQEAQHTLRGDGDSGRHRKERVSNRKTVTAVRVVFYLLIAALCAYGWWQITLKGYEMAKSYVDASVQTVRQENAVKIQELEQRIDFLGSEMTQLKDSLNNAGSSISNSTSVQQRIDERLGNLDKQLKDLENSLKILKEAP